MGEEGNPFGRDLCLKYTQDARNLRRWIRFACLPRKRDAAGFNVLFRDFHAWQTDHGEVPADLPTFRALLAERGFGIGKVIDTELVYGLAFRDDLDSIARFLVEDNNQAA